MYRKGKHLLLYTILGGIILKRKILAALIGSMLITSVGFSAPVLELEQNQTAIGYGYSKLEAEVKGLGSAKENFNSLYVQHKLSDKVVLGLEQLKTSPTGGELKLTDLIAQYSVDENLNFALGARKYHLSISGFGSDSETKAIFGVNYHKELGEKVTGYASYLKSSYEDEWKIGVTYKMSSRAFLDVNYSYHDADAEGVDLTFKGLGIGIGFIF